MPQIKQILTTEHWYRKFFIQSLDKELKPRGLTTYDEIAILEARTTTKFPDIVIVDPKTVTESHGIIVARKDGIKAVIETKHPKKIVDAGLFQTIQYMNQIHCKFGFATNFKDIIGVTLGESPAIDKESLGEKSNEATLEGIAKFIVEIISGERSLTAVEENDKVIVDLLHGAVSELLGHTEKINPSLLEEPLGFFLAKSFDRKLTTKVKNSAMKQAAAYMVINQIVFYNLLSAETGWFEKLRPVDSTKQLQDYFDKVSDKDWKAVFKPKVALLLQQDSIDSVNKIIGAVTHLRLDRIKYDILGKIFHDLIPFEIRKRVAAYYTSNAAAFFLTQLTVKNWRTTVLDPSCGSGTLLVLAYSKKRELTPSNAGSRAAIHKKLLNDIYGVDITPFASHLAVVHLSLQELIAETEEVKITVEDAFNVKPYGSLEFLGGGVLKRRMTADGEKPSSFKIPQVDLVVQNPPFTRGERLEEKYKTFLEKSMIHVQPKYIGKARVGLHCYFILHAADFLKLGGEYAAVLPEAVFVADYAKGIRKFILENFRIEYFVTSESKTTFSEGCDFKEVLFVAQKERSKQDDWTAKFIVLKQDLSLTNSGDIAQKIAATKSDTRNATFDLKLVKKSQLMQERNWMKLTRSDDLNLIVNVISASKQIEQGRKVMILSEGMHLDSEFFFVPNDDWKLVKADEKSVAVENLSTGETVQIEMPFLRISLRRPEFHQMITPELNYYMLVVPPQEKSQLPNGLRRYLDWAEMKGAHKKQTIADYSRRKGIPWYSYMHDQVYHARTKATGRIAFVEKFRLKNRSCIAHYFDFNVLGTNSYFFGSLEQPIYDKVLVAWFNSSVFLALFLHVRREIAGDWGRIKIHDLENLSCLNPKLLSHQATEDICMVLDRIREMQLPPIPDQLNTSPRRELDESIIQALQIPDPQLFIKQLYSTLQDQIRKLY